MVSFYFNHNDKRRFIEKKIWANRSNTTINKYEDGSFTCYPHLNNRAEQYTLFEDFYICKVTGLTKDIKIVNANGNIVTKSSINPNQILKVSNNKIEAITSSGSSTVTGIHTNKDRIVNTHLIQLAIPNRKQTKINRKELYELDLEATAIDLIAPMNESEWEEVRHDNRSLLFESSTYSKNKHINLLRASKSKLLTIFNVSQHKVQAAFKANNTTYDHTTVGTLYIKEK